MLVNAEPVLPDWGVPTPEQMERWEGAGKASGMGGLWDTINTALEKVQLPGFGTPIYEPGTVITTPEGQVIRQQEGYPTTGGAPYVAGAPRTEATFDFSPGAAIAIGAGALMFMVVMMRGGKGGGK